MQFHGLGLATWFLASAVAVAPGQRLFGSSFGGPRDALFDYVVVGGGTAGLSIASRLAEDGTNSVAVIEAGLFYKIGNSNNTQVPAFCVFFIGQTAQDVNPLIDWGFFTTPQEVSQPKVMLYAPFMLKPVRASRTKQSSTPMAKRSVEDLLAISTRTREVSNSLTLSGQM